MLMITALTLRILISENSHDFGFSSAFGEVL